MNKLAIKVVSGDFEQGFPIILRQGENLEIEGTLPAAPNLPQDYKTWQLNYHTRPGTHRFRTIKPIPVQVTNYSNSDLKDSINTWLNSAEPEFRPLRDKIIALSHQNEQKEIIMQTDDVWFWRIPWHLWDVLDDKKIEVILSASQYEKLPQVRKIKPKDEVKILVILGDSTNIDVKSDLLLLQKELPHAYIQSLLQPRKTEVRKELWEQEWDILFFAGHSFSEGGEIPGEFQINPQEKLTIEELKHGLENAIKNGLQLAIFNSCDGIGLGRELMELQLPATIVMREPVLDIVAQRFLEYFLKAFAIKDKTLSASVREARERLREIEDKYFCASMLPLICHNPATEMPTWRSFLGHVIANQTEKKDDLTNNDNGNIYQECKEIDVNESTNHGLPSYIKQYQLAIVGFLLLGLILPSTFQKLIFTFNNLRADIHNRRGVRYYQLDKKELAVQEFNQALKLNPKHSKANSNKGRYDEDMNQPYKAGEKYNIACEGGLIEGCNNLARWEILYGDPQKAENIIIRIVESRADNDEIKFVAYKNLGWSLVEQEKYEEAEPYLEKAKSLMKEEEEGSPYCLLAQVKKAQKKYQKELDNWDLCRRLTDPKSPEEKSWLQTAEERLETVDNRR
ncbi:CHAT domain-containing tetratricopeptide repeat protein [Oscillatoria salina]|uniref:CHAT domain-containing tetratricopeptide repeat protein n=1 Tax=Oscillatoria salina TaxID=331517 RepID=UPI001CCB646B|nr:CHAT domain-containing protein [Oscillatoria salina]MBZ8180949.1 CHAT domain-containing protein [Oscillatoria salina IIICB1]